MVYESYHSHVQNKRHQTYPTLNKHVEAIEQCSEYLAEALGQPVGLSKTSHRTEIN